MLERHADCASSMRCLENRHAGNFRYLLLKCVDRWNVYFNTLLIVALFFSL
nr:MAG TPA: hypothetical protein [Bacteriophage sp.]